MTINRVYVFAGRADHGCGRGLYNPAIPANTFTLPEVRFSLWLRPVIN